MNLAAKSLLLLAAMFVFGGCHHAAAPATPPPVDVLAPSPRLILGRIIAIDAAQGFAFVELAADSPPSAVAAGTELITRTMDLRETGRLEASRYVRSRTLGTKIVRGQPTPGDEVVWLAP